MLLKELDHFGIVAPGLDCDPRFDLLVGHLSKGPYLLDPEGWPWSGCCHLWPYPFACELDAIECYLPADQLKLLQVAEASERVLIAGLVNTITGSGLADDAHS